MLNNKQKVIFGLLALMVIPFPGLFAQWESDVRLTNDPAISFVCNNNAWCVSAEGNNVHVVWYDARDGNYEIYYKRSTDDGVTWGSDTRLTNNTANSEWPAVSVSNSIVHVVWYDDRSASSDIYYKRSTDGGVTWGADTNLVSNNIAGSYSPSVRASGSSVHVVWRDDRDGNYEIYYKRSTDGGATWGADTRLSNYTGGSWYPSVNTSGSMVHVVWHDDRNGHAEIFYKCSTDGGLTWGSDIRLTNNPAGSCYPSVGVSDSLVHVVWYDWRDGHEEIYYKRSADGGLTWGTDTRLTNKTAYSENPSVSAWGSNVHLVWEDWRDGSGGEIYYKRSTDGGLTWESDTRLTNSTGTSGDPAVSISGSNVHVAWYDYRDGNYEIYYKRDPTGNVGIEEKNDNQWPVVDSRLPIIPDPFVNFATIPGCEKERFAIYDASGWYRGICNGSRVGAGLSPGVYFLADINKKFNVQRIVKIK